MWKCPKCGRSFSREGQGHYCGKVETVDQYIEEQDETVRIIAACGNDCSSCPRYVAHPFEKTEEELHHTAELWMKIGYRDRVVTNREISCSGCSPENWCRYHVVMCCEEIGIKTCALCTDYPCENIKECFKVTRSFEQKCREACTAEEYGQLKKAFFEKERNLNSPLRHEKVE